MRGSPTDLTRAVAIVEEFRADWEANADTVNQLAEKWGVSKSTIKAMATRLRLSNRQRGRKKARDGAAAINSPAVLADGEWISDGRVMRWRPRAGSSGARALGSPSRSPR